MLFLLCVYTVHYTSIHCLQWTKKTAAAAAVKHNSHFLSLFCCFFFSTHSLLLSDAYLIVCVCTLALLWRKKIISMYIRSIVLSTKKLYNNSHCFAHYNFAAHKSWNYCFLTVRFSCARHLDMDTLWLIKVWFRG